MAIPATTKRINNTWGIGGIIGGQRSQMPTQPLLLSVVALLLLVGKPVVCFQAERDKSSIELVVRGCLKGRELTADDISGSDDLEQEVGMIFRLSAKGEVGNEIKRQNGHLVEVTGLVKKTALATPGLKIGGGRIVIGGGGPASRDPTRDPARNPSRRIVPMDTTQIELISESCPRSGGNRH